jgi:hypothetical protein
MTNQVFVNDALSLINVLPVGMDASAEDADLALRVTTELADEWQEDGVTINWSPNPSVADECPLTGQELTAVKHHVAIRLCPHFGREPSPTLIALAQAFYMKLQRNQMVRGIGEIEIPMPASETRARYNILTDE